MFAETAELAVRISLKDNVSAGVRGLQRNLAGLNGSLGRVGRGVGQIGTGLARAGLLVGGAAITGIAAAAKAAADFEDAFAGVRKTVSEAELKAAGLTFEDLAAGFRQMATEIPVAATELARIGEVAGALGVDVRSIKEFTRVVAELGVTTDLSSDQAAEALGKIGTILNLTDREFRTFADTLVGLGNAGASLESEIIEVTKRFAAMGRQAGLSNNQILGLASSVSSLGIEPEAAGSALSRVFANMTAEIANATKKGKAFAAITGQSLGSLKKQIDKGGALGILLTTLQNISKLSRTEAASVLRALGITNVRDRNAILLMSQNLDEVNRQLGIAETSAGALGVEAGKRFATLSQQVVLLKNNLFEAAITIGEGMLPALKRATDQLIKFLQAPENKTALRNLGQDIGAAIDKIDWKAVLDGAKSFVGIMKGALDFVLLLASAVDKLPIQIKAAGLGFLALNKLSGGLIGQGVGNVVGGLTGAAARGIASRIPGVGAVFAQPVYVTNWPAGGFGGPAGGAAGGAASGGAAAGGLLAPGLGTAALGIGAIIAAYQLPVLFRRETPPSTVVGAQGMTLRPGEATTNLVLSGSPNFYNLAALATKLGVIQGFAGTGISLDIEASRVHVAGIEHAVDMLGPHLGGAIAGVRNAIGRDTDQQGRFGSKLDRIAALDSTANAKLSQIAAKRTAVALSTVVRLSTTVRVSARDVARSKVIHDSYVSKMTNAGVF